MSAPRCTVGLLTWNGGDDAVACVRAARAQTEPGGLEWIWIDNASTDGTVARLRRECPDLPEPIVHARNTGFCAGHNQAIAACRTPYYLALNQDVALAPDYVEKLCDWMDATPHLALASGLIFMGAPGATQSPDETPTVFSAGLVFPRTRFGFQLGMGGPPRPEWRRRRWTAGVDGSAMMLRVEACRRVARPRREVFPESFFAYGEEVDLSMRLARIGLRCGVEGAAEAVHRVKGSGGFARPEIRARYFANHWLLTLRHDAWGDILRDLPYIVRGELQYWLREYVQCPGGFLRALGLLARGWREARTFDRRFERCFGPTRGRLAAYRRRALAQLRAAQPRRSARESGTTKHTKGTRK